ncbi:MAG: CbiX/SirB N-terminal domain-containing protein [Nitrospirae bacterium]|nr:CbiX/SirB N-terminal domain-containing protein [Nitrospirota bacterium]
MKTSVILLGHGSMASGGNAALAEVAEIVRDKSGLSVTPAFLQFVEPSLTNAVVDAIDSGALKVVIMPYFLYLGNHVAQDIPEELDALRARYPSVEMVMASHLGAHPKLAEIVMERIEGLV